MTGPGSETGSGPGSETGSTGRATNEHRSVVRMRTVLTALGVTGEIQVLPDSTRTAAEAAAELGCEVGAIASSLVFDAGGEPVLGSPLADWPTGRLADWPDPSDAAYAWSGPPQCIMLAPRVSVSGQARRGRMYCLHSSRP